MPANAPLIAILAEARTIFSETLETYPFRATRAVGEPWPDELTSINFAGKFIIGTFDGQTHFAFTLASDLATFIRHFPEPEDATYAYSK